LVEQLLFVVYAVVGICTLSEGKFRDNDALFLVVVGLNEDLMRMNGGKVERCNWEQVQLLKDDVESAELFLVFVFRF
jgi:hypothetical protein